MAELKKNQKLNEKIQSKNKKQFKDEDLSDEDSIKVETKIEEINDKRKSSI